MDIYIPTKPVYYVYAYLREDYTPYYIGKGKYNRAYRKTKKDIIKPPKNKSRIIIIQDNLTELQSFILERYYIRWFGRKDNNTGILRNMTDGGEGSSGYVVTEETKKKISLSLKGKPLSEETKKKMSLSRKGRTHSEETKKKMSLSKKGIELGPLSEETKKKMSLSREGRTHSEETKKKMSLSGKGRTHSEETKKKMSLSRLGKPAANKGVPHTEETKKKMSELKKLFHQSKKMI